MDTKTEELSFETKHRDLKILQAIILNVEALSTDFSGKFRETMFDFLDKKVIELENREARKEDKYSQILHTTVGVYKNQSHKINGVLNCNLTTHIRYNLDFRYGRALFVDGTCVNRGYLSDEEVATWTEKIKSNPAQFIMKKDTQPYM